MEPVSFLEFNGLANAGEMRMDYLSPRRPRKAFPSILQCAVLFVLAGCGAKTDLPLAPVSGTITINQVPAPNLSVIFQPENGRPSMAITDESGRYELRYSQEHSGALIGRHTVLISSGDVSDAGVARSSRVSIPEEYNRRSMLSAEVKSGRNRFDFDLKISSP
jgi:hypothetical protein